METPASSMALSRSHTLTNDNLTSPHDNGPGEERG